MSKQDLLKSQTCVLKVNIHCDGCKDKVKKLLSKIEGVYTVKIDAEQGKVTVTGNVNPEILVKKLIKSGKHAELSSVQKGSNNFQNQFKNMQNLDNFVKNKSQKQNSGNNNNNNNNKDKMQQEVLKQIMKGAAANNKDHHGGTKNNKAFFSKDHNKSSGKFNGDFDHSDCDDDCDDDDSDEYDDGSLDGFSDDYDYDDDDSLEKMMKQIKGGPKSNGVSGKKSGGLKMSMPFMGMLSGIGGGGKNDKGGGKKGNKKENEGKKGGKNEKEGKKGGKNDKVDKKGGDGKNKGGDQKKGGEGKNGNNEQKKGKNKSGNGKKGGGNSDVFSEMDIHNKGKVGGGMGQMGPMGINFPMGHHMGGNPAMHGIPTQSGMNGGGYYQGMGHGGNNPYNNNQQQQQQYMAMMMNQQRANGNGMHPQMMYARPQAPMNYGPPPVAVDNYTHMFSDENTGSCSIM